MKESKQSYRDASNEKYVKAKFFKSNTKARSRSLFFSLEVVKQSFFFVQTNLKEQKIASMVVTERTMSSFNNKNNAFSSSSMRH